MRLCGDGIVAWHVRCMYVCIERSCVLWPCCSIVHVAAVVVQLMDQQYSCRCTVGAGKVERVPAAYLRGSWRCLSRSDRPMVTASLRKRTRAECRPQLSCKSGSTHSTSGRN